MLSKEQIGVLVEQEALAAIDYQGEISQKRARLLDYYNQQPFGDEVEGQSQVVTTDVADTIEWMVPSMLRTFTQGKELAKFDASREEFEDEAEEKQILANHIFFRNCSGVLVLHDMFKDAFLQFTGTVKVCWDDSEDESVTEYEGLSDLELMALEASGAEIETIEDNGDGTYNARKVTTVQKGRIQIDNVPPEEFLISKTARNFKDPIFIGHRSPKTRSELIKMGFKRKLVDNLPADTRFELTDEKAARFWDYDRVGDSTATHHPNDVIYLGEYYMQIDVDEDGKTEYVKVFYAGNECLEWEEVEDHPFAVFVPIPIPHRAVGTCPAEQVADIQFRQSTLVRQMLNNIYMSNYPRILHSSKVDLDDLLTPRSGGTVEVDTDMADVGGHAVALQSTPMIEPILAAIERTEQERESRSGVSRHGQGLDPDMLNKTATGFRGIMDASQQRLELMARIAAEGGVKRIFELIIDNLGRYQDGAIQLKITGKELEIDPSNWRDNTNVRIDVGTGSGDRQEKIFNLNNILMQQKEFLQLGLPLVDQAKMYNTLDKLVNEVGLKDVSEYFNDVTQPDEVLLANNEKLIQLVQQYEQAQTNPLAEAEMVKTEGANKREAFKGQLKMAELEKKTDIEMSKFFMKMAQDQQKSMTEMAMRLTELEQEVGKDLNAEVEDNVLVFDPETGDFSGRG